MNTKNKIIKISKVCYIISKVLYILSFVAFLVLTILAISLSLTNAISAWTAAETATIFGTLALYAFICIGLLWNVEGVFKCITEQKTPFNDGVSHYLKKIAVFILLLSAVPSLVGSIILRIACPASEITFPIEFGGMISALVLFFIGLFFQYGSELQRKDDETL